MSVVVMLEQIAAPPPVSLFEDREFMVSYRAMFKFVEGGVHAEVLDFPGVLTCGATLDEARSLLHGALVDLAETNLMHGEPLPTPDPTSTSDEADLDEPIHLLLTPLSPN